MDMIVWRNLYILFLPWKMLTLKYITHVQTSGTITLKSFKPSTTSAYNFSETPALNFW